ncbi:SPW repeat domain-containing protein [Saccharopolyspora montiporae]|uniref:SPW repeat domain-containing protein n=1 Tax=Saccharopolyspora montiporae TaxID=2781240 RepID=UPI00351C4BB5
MSGDSRGSAVRPWVRWQDWLVVVLGVYLVLATTWTSVSGGGAAAMVVLGALLAVSSIWSLALPASMTSEYGHMLLGVLLFLAPWVLGYTAYGAAAWTSWVIGVLAVVAGAAALPEAGSSGGRTAGQH